MGVSGGLRDNRGQIADEGRAWRSSLIDIDHDRRVAVQGACCLKEPSCQRWPGSAAEVGHLGSDILDQLRDVGTQDLEIGRCFRSAGLLHRGHIE